MGQGDAARQQSGDETARSARVVEFLDDGDRVGQFATATTGMLGERHAQQTEGAGLLVERARQLALTLPIIEVWEDFRLGESAYGLSQRVPLGGGHSSTSGTSTYRERSHSPSAFACGSNRACEATPSPRRSSITKFRAHRLGRTCLRRGRSVA